MASTKSLMRPSVVSDWSRQFAYCFLSIHHLTLPSISHLYWPVFLEYSSWPAHALSEAMSSSTSSYG